MQRRALLGTVAASAAAIAGCTTADARAPLFGADGADDDGNESDDGDSDGTGTPSGDAPTLQDVTFEVVDSGCGAGGSTADVSTDEAAGEVTVEGTITGSDACYTAELEEAVYGAETDSLWVDVVSTREEGAGVCAQCITSIRYRVTLPFEGGLPGRVAVTHDGELACPGDGPGRGDGPAANNSSAGDSPGDSPV